MELKIHRKNSAIIMTSRIRLARNLAHSHFANAASPEELSSIFDKCVSALSKVSKFRGGRLVKMSEISEFGKGLLVEERHATRELVNATDFAGVYISKDGATSAMINEEDHLRIQSIADGQKL